MRIPVAMRVGVLIVLVLFLGACGADEPTSELPSPPFCPLGQYEFDDLTVSTWCDSASRVSPSVEEVSGTYVIDLEHLDEAFPKRHGGDDAYHKHYRDGVAGTALTLSVDGTLRFSGGFAWALGGCTGTWSIRDTEVLVTLPQFEERAARGEEIQLCYDDDRIRLHRSYLTSATVMKTPTHELLVERVE